MLEMKIQVGRRRVPPSLLPELVGKAKAMEALGEYIDGLMLILDDLDGDPDDEPEEDVGVEDLPHDPNPPLKPEYDLDQSAGPNNFAYELQCHNLNEQILDLDRRGQAVIAARTREALGRIQDRRRATAREH